MKRRRTNDPLEITNRADQLRLVRLADRAGDRALLDEHGRRWPEWAKLCGPGSP